MRTISKSLGIWGLIAILCVFPHLAQSCAKGCLRCGSDSKCSACDSGELYYRKDDGTCDKVEIENCQISGYEKNECMQCGPEMTYDPNTSKCVGVASNKKEPKCEYYNQAGECVACEREHFLKGGECFPATLEVEHCLVFSKADFCQVCEGNRRFDEDTGKCVDFTPVSNCAIHSQAVCDECLHEYALLPRSEYIKFNADLFSQSELESISFMINDVSFNGNYRQTAPTRCLKMNLHCDKYTFDATTRVPKGCEVCSTNYLLNSESGECENMPSPVIENCMNYSNNTTCQQCLAKYYLENNECKAHTEVANCSIYEPNSNTCKECEESHFLSNSTTCTERTRASINNCDKLNLTADECLNCATDFRHTDDKKACLGKIDNCSTSGYAASTFETAEFLCDTCNGGYYPDTDKKSCLKQSGEHCNGWDAGTNSCNSCINHNFYLDGVSPSKTCKAKTKTNCLAFTDDFDNKCKTCNLLYSLDSGTGECTALTDANCVRNTSNTTTCLACKPGYVLDGSNPCKQSTRGYDDLCIESQTTEGQCTKCKMGYKPYKTLKGVLPLPANCAAADATTGKCTQCKEGMDGTPEQPAPNEAPPACSAKAGEDKKCLQLKAGVFEALDDNDGKCAKCQDYSTNYLTGDTCTARTTWKSYQCKELNNTADSCTLCNEFFRYESLGNTVPICMPNPPGLTELPNCDIYDYFNNKKCLKCLDGYTLTAGDPDTCSGNGTATHVDFNKFHLDFEDNMKLVAGPKANDSVTDCEESVYVYNGVAGEVCTKCKANTTAQVEASVFAGHLDDFTQTNNLWTFSKQHKITNCAAMTKDDYVKYEASTDNTALAANCEHAADVGSSNGFRCVKCKSGFVGIVKSLAFNKSGTAMTAVLGYAECKSASDYGLQIKNKNQGFRGIKDDGSEIIFVNQNEIVYDSCFDTSKSPVLFMKLSGTSFEMQREGAPTKEQPEWNCKTIPDLKKIGACVAYFLEADDTSDPRDYTQADFKCFKCSPGNRLNIEKKDGAFFGTCLEIENCEKNPTDGKKNDLLDACQTCKAGFSWDYLDTADLKIPNIQKCVDSRRFPGCMVMNSSTKKCVLCEPGKTMNPKTEKCEDYPSVCGTQGFPHLDVASFSGNAKSRDYNNAFFRYYFGNYLKTGRNLCATCAANSKFFMGKDVTEGGRNICKSIHYSSNIIEGCKIYKGDSTDCSECYPEFVYDETNKNCVRRILNNNLRYCKTLMTSASSFFCKECSGGRVANTSGACVTDHNCESFTTLVNGSRCDICVSGYKISSDQWRCEEVEYNDPCVKYNKSGDCLACKDPEKTLMLTTTSSYTLKYRCVTNPASRKSKLSPYSFTYKLSGVVKKEADYTGTVPSDSFLVTNFALNSSLVEYLCLRDYEDCGCKSYTDDLKCNQCKDLYWMDTDLHKCIAGRMDGCLKFSGKDSCDTCDFDHPEKWMGMTYYKSGSKCIAHTVKYCESFSSSSDTCTQCIKGYYENSGKCHANKLATNCLEFVQDQDKCTKCANAYYLDGTVCKPHTVTNCKTYNATTNSCDDCEDDYYRFQNSGVFKCAKNTAPNCKTKSKTANACSSCEDGEFYPKGADGCLSIVPIPNCSESDKTNGLCAKCADGYWLRSDKKCNANPTGVKNCVLYSDKTTCTKCEATHFLSENSCVLLTSTVNNCLIHSGQGICGTCMDKNIKSSDGKTCSPVTEQSCATWKDIQNCETCSGNNVLKTNDDTTIVCVASGIDHCIQAKSESGTNTCEKCNTGFILREGKCHAPKVSISNCEEYDVETEKCNVCFNGFLLTKDKDKCEDRILEAGQFCAKGHLVDISEPVCSKCKFGHYEDVNGECVQCGGDGCMACDLTDVNKCVLCSTKYYMTAEGTCSENDPKAPISVKVMGILSALSLVFLLWRE